MLCGLQYCHLHFFEKKNKKNKKKDASVLTLASFEKNIKNKNKK